MSLQPHDELQPKRLLTMLRMATDFRLAKKNYSPIAGDALSCVWERRSSCAKPAKAADLGGDCCADLEERVADLEATTVRKGNKKVSVQIYGKVNYAAMWWDDGGEQNLYVVNKYMVLPAPASKARPRSPATGKVATGWSGNTVPPPLRS